MTVAKSIKKVRKIIQQQKRKGKTIGFVPTMGALHNGHLCLIKAARNQADFVVVSIFVNPLQFAPDEDLRRYPRNFKKDESTLKKAKTSLVFYPDDKTMYPKRFSTYVEETRLSRLLCGQSRPVHFKGVATIVNKLFNIVEPDTAFFGQKDYQQAKIIGKMVHDLNMPVKIKILPIIRETDGLAMSSRNLYLNPAERKDALILYQSIKLAKELVKNGKTNTELIKSRIRGLVNSKNTAKIDYIQITDTETLESLNKIEDKAFLGLAVYIGKTRLIDNAILRSKDNSK